MYVIMLTNGNVKRSGEKLKLLSIAKRSLEMTEINFPEFVAIRDFIDSLVTLSNMTATRVRLIRMESMKPMCQY